MISTIAMVGLGGALGAIMRYCVSIGTEHALGAGFPWATIIVNVMGSLMMGILIAKLAMMEDVSNDLKALYASGFLGAFTTFSTFSLDFVMLWQRGEMIYALGYMLASVVLSILALGLGLLLMRGTLS